jgi:hypothetical protein
MAWRHTQVLLAATTAAFALVAGASNAVAFECSTGSAQGGLHDGLGYDWSTNDNGEIFDGSGDAYDGYGDLKVTRATSTFTYGPPDPKACSAEAGGRQIIFPSDEITTGPLSGLVLSRKLYVPATGLAFARMLLSVTNATGAPITPDQVLFDGDNLGSDGDTQVVGSSSGDGVMDATDAWSATNDTLTDPQGDLNGDPALTHVWAGEGTVARKPDVVTQSGDQLDFGFTTPTIAPGQTFSFIVVEAQRGSSADAVAAAQALSASPIELYAGLTPAEIAQVVNFPADGDGDRDGRPNSADNCPSAANPDQADLDRDGAGDVCDDDIDGDGASNAEEALRGSDPRKVDTDGDGVNDKVDACPATFGRNANGCPGPERDTTKPVVTVKVPKSLKHRTIGRKAVAVKVTTNEAATVAGALIGTSRRAHVARAGDLVLAEAKLRTGTGTRTLRLKVAKKLADTIKSRRYRLRIVLTVTDASGNATIVTRTVKVR